jgi:hypothetical protein
MESSVDTESLNLNSKMPISMSKAFTPRISSSIANLLEDLKGTNRVNEIMNSRSPDYRKKGALSIEATRRPKKMKSQQSSPRKKKVQTNFDLT